MKKHPTYKRLLCALMMAILTLNCAVAFGEQAPSGIPNGDFEMEHAINKWTGWTRADAAFNVRGLVTDEKLSGAVMEKSGEYYFAGSKGGNPAMRGTLTSDVFTLGGNGFVTFKMGAGKNTEKVYVEFFEEGGEQAIARVVNADCDGISITDHLLTKVVDLSAYIGKNLYIKITDNDDGADFAYVNFDAFKVLSTDEEIAAANADYARQIEAYGARPFTEDETATTIQNGGFETGDLTGWLTLSGTALARGGVVSTSQYYWTDRSVYGEGEYYLDGNNNGAIAESLTGAIRSTKFTLGGDGFISFMIGAGNKNCYVALCDGNTDEELIVMENTYFSDPALALTLLRVYMDASAHLGKVVYLKVVDNNDTSSFAFINVDDFRVSLTRDEVAALEIEQIEKIQNETYTSASYNDPAALLNYYNNYPYPVPLMSLAMTKYAKHQVVDCGIVDVTAFIADAAAAYGDTQVTDFAVSKIASGDKEITEGFDAVDMSNPGYYHVTYGAEYNGKAVEAKFTVVAMADKNVIANGGFESGDLAGWTILADNWGYLDGQPTGVISAKTYWGENLPYNQSGDYHMDGWNNGIPEGETWQLRSTNFTLSGSGFISVKMGANAAAVRVYLADGTEIGHYKQTRFSDTNFPSLKAGGSWADMGTYVIDLSAYIGQEMYVVLCDEQVDGWAQAFFDEIVTYYEQAPDWAKTADTVGDGVTGEEVLIPWQLAENLK